MNFDSFLTKFLIFLHPLHIWVCIRSDLKPLFETDMSDSSYSDKPQIIQNSTRKIEKLKTPS